MRLSQGEVVLALAGSARQATQPRLDSDRRLGSDYWGLFERAATRVDVGGCSVTAGARLRPTKPLRAPRAGERMPTAMKQQRR